MALLGAVVALAILAFFTAKAARFRLPRPSTAPSTLPLDDERSRLPLALGIVAVGLVAATSLAIPHPRYIVLLLPLSLAAVWLKFAQWTPLRGVRLGLLALWIVLNLLNQFGGLYPARFPASDPKTWTRGQVMGAYVARERSREIVREIREIQNVVAFIEREHPDALVVTRPPFGHLLALPFLGYVNAPVAGFCASLATDFTFPMCGLDALLTPSATNASLLRDRNVLLLYEYNEPSDPLPRDFIPELSPDFSDERVYDSGSHVVWKLDPRRVEQALAGRKEAP
jgi:hypothetical protein